MGGVGNQPLAKHVALGSRADHLDLSVRSKLVPDEHALLVGVSQTPLLTEGVHHGRKRGRVDEARLCPSVQP